MNKETGIRMSFSEELQPAKIKVIGVGGGGCNAVNRMIRAKVEGVEFIAANTDLQALKLSQAPVKLELGALSVAVVTKPFAFEGKRRMLQAEQALQELISAVDTVIVIPNERLMETVERGTSFFDAFRIADDIPRPASSIAISPTLRPSCSAKATQ